MTIVYDMGLAEKRIAETGRLYKIEGFSDMILTEDDFREAHEVYSRESEIVRENGELTDNGVFRGAIYSLLTPQQDYPGHIRLFEQLMSEGLDSPESVRESEEKLYRIFREGRVSLFRQKPSNIHELSEIWESLDFLERINEGIKTNREREILLRKGMIKDVRGFGGKTASIFLRMCGAEYLVPVDSWMAEMLYFLGYPVEMPRVEVDRPRWGTDVISTKKKKLGLKGRSYIEAEEFSLDLANKCGVPGYILQLAYWTKKSSYKNLSR